jgi:hypothetical protein
MAFSFQPAGLIQWCLLELQAWHYAQCRVNSYYTNVLNPGSLGLRNPADLV